MKRHLIALAALVTALAAALPLAAATPPGVIPLPNGFAPEGITDGNGNEAFAGSLADGSVVRADLSTGEVDIVVPAQTGRIAVGMDHDPRSDLLWVAGGPAGQAYAYDADTGDSVAAVDLGAGFINDVIVTRDAAWFTNSFAPVLHRVELDGAGHPTGTIATVPLSGDWVQSPGFAANGIVATPDGATLIVVNSALGTLYDVDPASGLATEIELDGTVMGGDGMALVGRSLYVVQNMFDQIAEVTLSPDRSSGSITDVITDEDFDIPTTAALFGSSLYAVNARFGTTPTPDTTYDIVRVRR